MTIVLRPPRSSATKFNIVAIIIGCLLWLCYFVALCLPALYFARNLENPASDYYPGWALLLLGWLETLGVSLQGMAWLANPFFAVGVLTFMLGFYAPSAALQIISAGFASLTFAVKTVMTDEAGNEHPVVGYGPGFWIWYLTIITALVTAVVFAVLELSKAKPAETAGRNLG